MKPTLYVMAAGMGSRYGGLKQLDPLGPSGGTIMDYSIFDAVRAGFGKVVFVIRHDFEDDFRAKILSKYEGHVPVEVVFQSLDELPEGFTAPAGRTKPWGTGQAVWMGRDAVKEPFAVINADDFYGRDAFEVIAKALSAHSGKKGDYCMVGFKVGNTLTENGSVSRGVCGKNADGNLSEIHERTSIHYVDGPGTPIVYDEGDAAVEIDGATPVSMNLWGFTPDYFDYTGREFAKFLASHGNEEKSEFGIPTVVDALLASGEATVKVLDTDSRWFGVTYAADRQGVVDRLADMHRRGEYPTPLFG